MKTVKLKAGVAITIADQNAPAGVTPSGAIVFEVRDVPDRISIQQVWMKYRHSAAGYLSGVRGGE